MKSVAILPGAFFNDVRNMFNRRSDIRVESNPRRYGCDALVFVGGDDIDPGLYGEKKIPGTYVSPDRDSFEIQMYEFVGPDIPKIGICRGAQLLNVLSGGSMWQDTDGHHTSHPSFIPATQKVLVTSSMHHQMMRPGPKGEVVMVADQSSYVAAEGKLKYKREEPFDDIEVIWYPETKSYCYQGHPEIGSKDEVEFFFQELHDKLGI